MGREQERGPEMPLEVSGGGGTGGEKEGSRRFQSVRHLVKQRKLERGKVLASDFHLLSIKPYQH